MGVGVQRNADVAVAHDVLQRFGIHPVLCHFGAERVPANMGRDLRQLHLIDLIVLLYDMLEILLPMERDHRHPVLVKEKESGMPVDDRLDLRLCARIKDFSEASLNLRRHRYHALSAFGLGVLNHIFLLRRAQKLMVNDDLMAAEINTGPGQSAKLGDSQSGME